MKLLYPPHTSCVDTPGDGVETRESVTSTQCYR